MKRAKAKINIKLLVEALKVPYGVELVSALYVKGTDHIEIELEGSQLPVNEYKGKGKVPEIIYDPRPTWTVAGMAPKGKKDG